jgi:hypothetical protein
MARGYTPFTPDMSGQLTDAEFVKRYPGVVAMSSNGHVSTALTRSRYIAYDYRRGVYVSEPRH